MRKPTRAEIVDAIKHEWEMIAADIETLSIEQWRKESLCEGWSVGEVANHLMYATKFPVVIGWRGSIGLAIEAMWHRHPNALDRWQTEMAALGPLDTASRLRSSRLPFTARFPGSFGPRGGFFEQVVHSEDIRKPLAIRRAEEPAENVTWATLRTWARIQYRKLKVKGRLGFEAPSGDAFTLSPRIMLAKISDGLIDPDAVVRGSSLEMLLFVAGRPAEVEIDGDGPFADAVRETKLTV